MSWYTILNLAPDTAEVRMYDSIGGGGITARQFCEEFNGLKAAKIDLRINSPGGEVYDATAICTAIREHPAEVTAHVDGLAASAASVIAAACDSLQMGKGAFLMIHNPMSMAFGNAADMRKEADTLDKLAGSIAQVYCDKTGKPMDAVRKAMDDETWFDAQEAKAWGLADVVKNDSDDEDDEDNDPEDPTTRNQHSAINSLPPLLLANFKNMPDALRRRVLAQSQRKEPAMLKPTHRDGKNFVNIDGKEHELELPLASATIVSTVATGKTEAEVAAAIATATAKAADDAVAKERQYRAMFATVVATAGLAGKDAEKFEKDFYGRAETDLKFLASHAIGTRTTAAGEGSGELEGAAATDADKAKAAITKYCTERFKTDPSMRRNFRVATANAKDPSYQAGLERFIAVETKSRADWATKPKPDAEDEATGNDPITNLLKNRSVYGGNK